jgi:hypothetical protein
MGLSNTCTPTAEPIVRHRGGPRAHLNLGSLHPIRPVWTWPVCSLRAKVGACRGVGSFYLFFIFYY